MKKVLSIWSMAVLAMCVVGFSSCSKDDDEGKGGDTKKFSQLLVGKWKYYAHFNSGWIYASDDSYIQFNSDGSLSLFSNYKTWEIVGEGDAYYGEYGGSYKVALKGHPTADDLIWDIGIIGKNTSSSLDLEGYDYPDILAGMRGGDFRYVRVK